MKEENKTLVKPHEAYYDIQTSMPILLIQYIFGINYEKDPGQEHAAINGCDHFTSEF